MPPTDAKGPARHVIRLIEQAESKGVDRQELLRAADLSESELADPDHRIPVIKSWQLWGQIMERIPDPDLGLELGSEVHIRQMGLVGYTMLHSQNLLEALQRLVRYARLLTDLGSALSLERHDENWRLVNPEVPAFLSKVRQPTDEALAIVLSVVREITGTEVVPAEVEFPYDPPANTDALGRFFRTELVFQAPASAMTFRSRDVELPLVAADEQLAGFLEGVAEEKLAGLIGKDTLAGRVRRAVWKQLSEGQPSVAQVAAMLNMSPRTLQRRLHGEGESFSEVVDGLRREMAPVLLRDPESAIYEVAYLLGYGEPSTFFRAFRRWHGRSPGEYRDHLLN